MNKKIKELRNLNKALLLIVLLPAIGCVELSPTADVPLPDAPVLVSAPNLSIKDGFYSLDLNWGAQASNQIVGVKIYRGESKNTLKELAIVPNTSKYLDTLVGVRKELYYTIAYQLSNGKISAFSDTLSKLPKEPINTSPSVGGEIGGIHYAWWKFQSSSFKRLTNTFTIHDEPSNGNGLYYTMYQGEINNNGFYFGIQTHVTNPNGNHKKGLIFSRWGTRDKNNYQVAPGGWGESAGYEGDFIGVRKNYEWSPGTYKTVLKQDSTVNSKDWYSVTIQRLPNGERVWIGSIAFEQSNSTAAGSNGIKSGGVNWTEVYWKEKGGSPAPSWHVSMDEVQVNDNEKPISAELMYAEKVFTQVNNSFTRGNEVHFIMGAKVVRYHKPRTILFTK